MGDTGLDAVQDSRLLELGEGAEATTPMAGLRKYVEWMTRGRRTDRVAYVLREWDLPLPLPGAQWQLDSKCNTAEELLRDPDLKVAFKVAIEKGAEIDIQRRS